MKTESLVLKIGIGCFIVLATLFALCMGEKANLFRLFTPSFFLSWGVVYLIDNHLWKLKWTKYLLGNVPDLNGQWTAVVRKQGDSDDHSMNVTIKQKWSSIHFEFNGDRVKSHSTIAELSKINNNYHIKYMWSGHFIDNSISPSNLEGAATLDFMIDNDTLIGSYWTFHPTNSTLGKMTFNRKGSN